jgi:hypothetical protein
MILTNILALMCFGMEYGKTPWDAIVNDLRFALASIIISGTRE